MEIHSRYKPVMEFLLSLRLFTNKVHTKRFDLSHKWKQHVSHVFSERQLEKLKAETFDNSLQWLDEQVFLSEGEESISSFLQSVEQENWQPTHPLNRHELNQSGKEIHDILKTWYDGYFQNIEQSLCAGLLNKKTEADEIIAQYEESEAVERITRGILLENADDRKIILTPQYHWRPIILYKEYEDVSYYAYAVDDKSLFTEEIPPHYMRIQQALSDERRLQLLRLLLGGKKSFKQLHEEIGLAKSTVHHHIIALRAAGLVRVHTTYGEKERYSFREAGIHSMPERLLAFLHGEGRGR